MKDKHDNNDKIEGRGTREDKGVRTMAKGSRGEERIRKDEMKERQGERGESVRDRIRRLESKMSSEAPAKEINRSGSQKTGKEMPRSHWDVRQHKNAKEMREMDTSMEKDLEQISSRDEYCAFGVKTLTGEKTHTFSEGLGKLKCKDTQTATKTRLKQQKDWSKGHYLRNFSNYFKPMWIPNLTVNLLIPKGILTQTETHNRKEVEDRELSQNGSQ